MTAKNRLSGLDGLRGILAILVAYAHAFGHVTGWDSGLTFVRNASFAVDVFFAMSGIVLLSAYEKSYGNSIVSWFKFVAIRFFRLWPLHAFTIVCIFFSFSLLAHSGVPDWISKAPYRDGLTDLAFLNGMGVKELRSINHPSWSVAVEFWIGSAFTITCFAFKKVAAPILGLMGLLLIASANLRVEAASDLAFGVVPFGVLRCVTAMGVGVTVYKALRIRSWSPIFVELASISGLLVILTSTINGPLLYARNYVPALIFSAAGIGFLTQSESVGLILDGYIFRLFGQLSYSIYLLHVPVIYVLMSLTESRGEFLVHAVMACTFICSYFVYECIERPCIEQGRRWFGVRP